MVHCMSTNIFFTRGVFISVVKTMYVSFARPILPYDIFSTILCYVQNDHFTNVQRTSFIGPGDTCGEHTRIYYLHTMTFNRRNKHFLILYVVLPGEVTCFWRKAGNRMLSRIKKIIIGVSRRMTPNRLYDKHERPSSMCQHLISRLLLPKHSE